MDVVGGPDSSELTEVVIIPDDQVMDSWALGSVTCVVNADNAAAYAGKSYVV